MQRGLVLGKFMPFHNGHIQLIEYARNYCSELIVWICISNRETMPAALRYSWVKEFFKNYRNIKPVLFEYDESLLPNSSESSREISKTWASAIKQNLPEIDVFISAEPYGDFVADFLGIKHVYFNTERAISATNIRSNPYKHWEFIPEIVKPYFFRKICILGTESTGKTTLTKKLAEYFNSDFVSEAGRDIAENTNTCKPEDLTKIAVRHANEILLKEKVQNKILFIDTDINITKSYSKFLFNQILEVDDWIINANAADIYLYLDNDAPFVQDGTRLSEMDRNKLDVFHRNELQNAGIQYFNIRGNWDNRFNEAIQTITRLLEIN